MRALVKNMEPTGADVCRVAATLAAVSSLKLLGRTPVGTTSLTTHTALKTLVFHAGLSGALLASSCDSADNRGQIAEEAIRVLANALLLHPMTRTDEVWNDVAVADALTSKAFASPSPTAVPSPFLASRLLYLITASPSAGVVTIVDHTPLVPHFRESLDSVAAYQSARSLGDDKGKQREAVADEQTWTEWLKVLFNLMVQYPRSASLFPSASPAPSPHQSPFLSTDDEDEVRSSFSEAEPVARSASLGPESLWSKRPRPFSRGSTTSLGGRRSVHSPSTSPPLPGPASDATFADPSRLAAPVPMGRSSSDMSRRTLRAGEAASINSNVSAAEDDGPRNKSRIQKLVNGVGEMGGRMLGRSGHEHDGSSKHRKGSKKGRTGTFGGSGASTRASESSEDAASVVDADTKFERYASRDLGRYSSGH